MYKGIAIIVVIDVILYIVARMVEDSRLARKGCVSVPVAVLLCSGAIILHMIGLLLCGAIVLREEGEWAPNQMMTVLGISLLTGAAPAIAYAMMAIRSFSTMATDFLYGDDYNVKPEVDVRKAQKLAEDGDIEGAVIEYRQCARRYPFSPDPLFGAATLLETAKRNDEAVETYRQIISKFKEDKNVWVKASRRLAELLRDVFSDAKRADTILAAIETRLAAPESAPKPTMSGAAAQKTHLPALLDRARSLADSDRVDDAVALFREVFEQRPEKPRPLFEAASALETAGRFEDAAELLEWIAQEFKEVDKVWGEAVFRLAGIYENKYRDKQKARDALSKLVWRTPGSEQAKLAKERIELIDEALDKKTI